jgi:tetratricopeptide (TPR) repeat protein
LAGIETHLAAQESEAEQEIAAGGEDARNRNYTEAISHFSRALEKDPINVDAFAYRGFMYLALGEMQRAIDDSTRAVQLDPNCARGYMSRGLAFKHRDELDKAISDITEAIRLEPDNYYNVFMRADIYALRDEYEKALADYDRAVELNPDRAIVLCGRGDLFAMVGDFDSAKADCLKAMDLDPKLSDPYIVYATMLATSYDPKIRDPQKAIENAQTALKLNPKNEDAWDTYAAALASAGKFEEAVEWEQRFASSKVLRNQQRVDAESRLALYRSHQPLIRPAPTSPWSGRKAAPTATPADDDVVEE